MSKMIIGCDVSRHNRPARCDYEAMSNHLRFAIIRACYGAHDLDESCIAHAKGFRSNGVQVGFYGFALVHHEPDDFARAFHSQAVASGWTVADLPLFIDIERPSHSNNAMVKHDAMSFQERVAWLKQAIASLESLCGNTVGIYSGNNYWRTQLGNTRSIGDRPLWAARYPLGQSPLTPLSAVPGIEPERFGAWHSWDIWQYTGHGRVDGYAGDRIDLNVMKVKVKTHAPSDVDCVGVNGARPFFGKSVI